MHPRAASSTKLKSLREDSTGAYPASSTASRPTAVEALLAVVTHRTRIILGRSAGPTIWNLAQAHDLSAFAAASISCRRHAQTDADNYGRAALATAASQKESRMATGCMTARYLQSLHPGPEANRPRSALLLDHLLLPPEAHGAAADQPECHRDNTPDCVPCRRCHGEVTGQCDALPLQIVDKGTLSSSSSSSLLLRAAAFPALQKL